MASNYKFPYIILLYSALSCCILSICCFCCIITFGKYRRRRRLDRIEREQQQDPTIVKCTIYNNTPKIMSDKI